MSKTVFADTFYYLALVSVRDAAHQKAVAASASTSSVVTSAWIIQELADGLAAPPARAGFLRLLTALEADPFTAIINPSDELWRRGIQLYRARIDKAWSLTDCISFEIMREHGIADALTADRHFEQAGFSALLK
jgi:uncharacterized protein